MRPSTHRLSIHIDAGYLYGALATRMTGSSNRAAIKVDEARLIGRLVELASTDSEGRLLRVLWYDAAPNGNPNHDQRRIGKIDSVKLRMGRINPYGEQKGVDLRLGLDLVSMGVNRSVEVAYVLSGDDDLTEAVNDAQDLGLQVKLICVPSTTGRAQSVAENLTLAADGILTIDPAIIEETVSRIVSPPAEPAPVTTPAAPAAPAPVAEDADDGGATRVLSAQDLAAAASGPARPTVIPPPAHSVVPPTGRPNVVPTPTGRVLLPEPSEPQAVPVYRSETGTHGTLLNGHDPMEQIDHDVIVRVAKSVWQVWSTSAAAVDVEALRAGRPNIPPAVDRILLNDLVNSSGVYDISTPDRFELRRQFWFAVDADR